MFIIFICLLGFYLALNLGANDVANAMGTSVGSGAVSLKKAIVIAGILEFTGAVLFGGKVTETLSTKIANPNLFIDHPQTLLWGMIAVLISCGLWLQIATSKHLPVASSHAVVGAIAGFSWVAQGINAVDWSSMGIISLTWIITPLISGSIAAVFYWLIKKNILDQPQPLTQLKEWIPWISLLLCGIFGIIVLPPMVSNLHPYLTMVSESVLGLSIGAIAVLIITLNSWHKLHQPSTNLPPEHTEKIFGYFQLLSACCVAFAHGSNDVGNAIAPIVTILHIQSTGTVPTMGLPIPLWVLILGGLGIVSGLAIWGYKVIQTIGESIIKLQPSGGFAAELATATTILLASSMGLPVSTSHGLVGAVVGIGIIQDWRSVKITTLKSIALSWLITIPFAGGLSAILFTVIAISNG
jgi:PiT family inorganic phosphate transporter